MRAARREPPWSLRRLARRCRYAAYIDSRAWYRRRERWHADHLALTGEEPVCAVCGQRWSLRDDDLHHRSYDRLETERHADLVPVCRAHHRALHDLWDASPAWRRLGRTRATDGILAVLRRAHTEGSGDDL